MPYTPSAKKHVEAISTIFQKGKIQLPSELRKSLDLDDGDKLLWIIEEGKWCVEKA